MTQLEKLEANEEKERRHRKASGRCFHCGKEITLSESELAHKIPAHKKYIKKYGREIIYHELNMDLTCHDCNHLSLLDPATHPVECAELVRKIREAL